MKNWSIGETLFMLFIAIPLALVLSGFTIVTLWQWFVVPVFHLPLLTIAQALGLALLVGYFTTNPSARQERTAGEFFAELFSKPLTCFALGWIFHWFL